MKQSHPSIVKIDKNLSRFLTLDSNLVQKQIDLKACRINYWEGGNGSNSPPILFLHGWGISAKPYHEILTLLAQHWPIIAPDLPSFAGSSYSESLESYAHYAEILLDFLNAIAVPKVHLIGHSFGGGIGITIAALSPAKIQSLMLVNSTGIPVGSIPEVLLRRAIEMPLQISLPKLHLQLVEIPQVFLLNLFFNTGNVIQSLFLSLEKDLTGLLSLIQVPCLVLGSRKDFTTPFSVAEQLHQRIRNSKLTIAEAGYHEWSLWYPEEFTAIVAEFVAYDASSVRGNSTT
ncbi:MAG: alpha/beta hydrolase [Leptolyngbyaceae cyanobacterium CSU_1_3]|nr:alpha/beta hydrolase [Leptolyngbyaceae cyanobacterium CSU_1_3]